MVEDEIIVQLFFDRDEAALSELSSKYGVYFSAIAERILCNHEDAMSCVNEAYLRAWNAIPPAHPNVLKAFVGKLVKCEAVSMLRAETAQKRGGGEITLVLDEVAEFVSGGDVVSDELEKKQLINEINNFLRGCREFDRRAFVLRYWHCESVSQIAKRLCASENKVAVSLFRTRRKLKQQLDKEGYIL